MLNAESARVFLASFLVLFLGVALIRWMPAYIRLLAYLVKPAARISSSCTLPPTTGPWPLQWLRGAFEYQGQKCSAASRAYIPGSMWKSLNELLLEMIGSIKVGPPEDFTNFVNAVIDRAAFDKVLRGLRARGKTPLALSLEQARADLRGATPDRPVTAVLLSDGGEDTLPRRDPLKPAEDLRKVPGVNFFVIGFDIGDREEWTRQPA